MKKGKTKSLNRINQKPNTGIKKISKKREAWNLRYSSEVMLAENHFDRGEYAKADLICRKILSEDANHPYACYLMGALFEETDQNTLAIEQFERTIASKPDWLYGYWGLARCYVNLNLREEAIEIFQQAIQLDSSNPGLHIALGRVLRNLKQLPESISVYRKALVQHPENAELHFALANSLRDTGKTEEAKRSYRKAILANPFYGAAYEGLSTIDKQRAFNSDIEAMLSASKKDNIPDQELKLILFALGKAHDDLGDYDTAFDYFNRANKIHRSGYSYSIEEEKERFESIKKIFDLGFVERKLVCKEESFQPIFIIGMPRSGSTLLEHILSSHRDISSAGELTYLDRLYKSIQRTATRRPFPEGIDRLEPRYITELGEDYLALLATHKPSSNYIIDKMPHNFLRVALINAALPNAKIIDCRRDPLGSCFSIYSTYLPDSHHYAFSLTEVGQYYRLYSELMDHWNRILPGKIRAVRYENIVEDTEVEVRKILDFCQLPFDKNCLSHQDSVSTVNTASHSQVRQPIYNRSIERWKNYEAHLQPLKTALGITH